MSYGNQPTRTRWPVVLLGGVSGLFFTLLAYLSVWLLFSLADGVGWDFGDTPQLFGQAIALFSGQFLAGYTGGRLAGTYFPGIHGSMAAIACYAVISVLGLVAGSPAGWVTLLIFGVVAAVLGYAGGVLAGRPRD